MPKTKAKAKTSKKQDYRYQEVTNKLITLLEKEQKPWVKPWSSTPFSNLISKHAYSGGNPLLLQIDVMLHDDWTSPYFVGFQQAKKLGWNIKKGSKATHILYAGSRKITSEEDGETKESFIPFAKWQNVFSIHCFNDQDADKKIVDFIPDETKGANKDDRLPLLEDFVKKQRAKIKHQGDIACYSSSIDAINMPDFKNFSSAYTYYTTLLHELSHRTGHKSRLDRDMTGKFGTISYSEEELVAELSSAFVANFLKLDENYSIEHHASYLKSWLSKLKDDNKFFFKALTKARKASDYLLDEAGLLTPRDRSKV